MTGNAPAPVVSIIVPYRDAEPHLEHCISAVRSQTLREIEIILIDDGSEDGSSTVAARHADADPRIRLLHQPPTGPGAARNTGLSSATGEYIAFVDSDDSVTPDMCTALADQANHTRADMVVGKREGWTARAIPRGLLPGTPAAVRFLMRGRISMGVWAKLYRRDFLNRHDIRFPPASFIEDRNFVMQCLILAERAVGVDRTVYRYHQRPDSTMANVGTKHVTDATIAYELDTAFLKQQGLFDRCGQYVALATLKVDGFLAQRVRGTPLADALANELERQRALFRDLPRTTWRSLILAAASLMQRELAGKLTVPRSSDLFVRMLQRVVR